MKLASFEAIVRALAEAEVRYLVAGGLAVNAHGYLRFTKDADLVIELVPDNLRRAFHALQSLGFKPSLPIALSDFADATARGRWVRERNMQVLQLWSDRHIETPIDLFATHPFDFAQEYDRALVKPLGVDTPVRFVSLPTLISMKEAAGREQDRIDVANLKLRLDEGGR